MAIFSPLIPIVENKADPTLLEYGLASRLTFPTSLRLANILAVGTQGVSKVVYPVLGYDIVESMESQEADAPYVIVIDTHDTLISSVYRIFGEDKRIAYLNFTDPLRSVGFNFLSSVTTRGQASQTAHAIAHSTPRGKDESAFWKQQVKSLLTDIIFALQKDPDQANLPRVWELIDGGADALNRFAIDHDVASIKERISFLRDSNNGQTVLSEASNCLEMFQDDGICAVASADEFRFQDFISGKTRVLHVHIPVHEVERLKPLLNLFLVQLNDWVQRTFVTSVKSKPSVSLIIEDLQVFQSIQGASRRLRTLRDYGCAITAAVQTLEDVAEFTGIFKSRFFLSPLAEVDANYLAHLSGECMYAEQMTKDGYEITQVSPVLSKVLTPHELQAIPHTEVFGGPVAILLPQYPVILAYMASALEEDAAVVTIPLRNTPLIWEAERTQADGKEASMARSSAGITNVSGWSDEQIGKKLEDVKKKLDWDNTTGSARKWWEAFEDENKHRVSLVLRLVEELVNRKATVTEFFLAYVYSNTDNIQANLHYLDYTRLKKEEERKKKQEQNKTEEQKKGSRATKKVNDSSSETQNSDVWEKEASDAFP